MRSLKLEHEVEKNKILSTALQTLATEHHELELSVAKGSSRRSALSEDEFHDAVSGECGGARGGRRRREMPGDATVTGSLSSDL